MLLLLVLDPFLQCKIIQLLRLLGILQIPLSAFLCFTFLFLVKWAGSGAGDAEASEQMNDVLAQVPFLLHASFFEDVFLW